MLLGDYMNTREKIIMTGIKFFSTLGYENTSMKMIAKETGIKKSSIYYHFKNKEDLFLNTIEHLLDSIEHHILSAINEKDSPQKKLDNIFNAIIEFNVNLAIRFDQSYSRPINCHQMLKTGTRKFIFIRERVDRYYDFLKNTIIKVLDEGKKNKTITNEIDTDILAYKLISIIEGYLSLSEIYSSITGSQIRSKLRETIWFSIKARSTEKTKRRSFTGSIIKTRW